MERRPQREAGNGLGRTSAPRPNARPRRGGGHDGRFPARPAGRPRAEPSGESPPPASTSPTAWPSTGPEAGDELRPPQHQHWHRSAASCSMWMVIYSYRGPDGTSGPVNPRREPPSERRPGCSPSVVSYPDRGPWGSATYRGNCSGYLIRDLLRHFQPASFLEIFAGGGTG